MNTKRDYYPAFVDSTIEKQRDDLLAMLERVTNDAANAYRAIAHVNESIIPTANLVTLDQARTLINSIKGE